MRLPSREMLSTRLPNASASGGSTEPQQERAPQPHALQRLAHHPRRQPLDVDGDVGQLRHD